MKVPIGGIAALLVAIGVVAALLIFFPAYRWFFIFSVGVGVIVALVLRWWYGRKPVKVDDTKHPLGLD